MINEHVEDCQARKGHDVHDDEVKPCDVDVDVGGVVAKLGGHDVRDVCAQLGVVGGAPGDFPEAWNVVEKSKDRNADDVDPCPAVCTEGSGLERQTHGHVPLDSHANGDIDASRLRDHPNRVHCRRDEGKDVVKVVAEPELGVGVNGGKAKHEDAGEDEDSVVARQACNNILYYKAA